MLVLVTCLIFVNLNLVFSYPYDPVYQGDYDVDHAIAMADIDHQLASLPYADDHHDYDKGEGESYGDNHYAVGGVKGDRGYNSHRGYDKGRVGNYGADGQKSHYNDEGGRKSGHSDTSNYYKDNHALVKGSHGNDYAVSNSFNKGSNTKGFHNVHHKEEYQKNRKFYDERNKSGHYSRYGDFGAALLAAAGKNAKGNYYDAAYKDGNYVRNGFADKGSLYNNLKKYADANGYDGYYGNYADYGRLGNAGYNNGYGYYH